MESKQDAIYLFSGVRLIVNRIWLGRFCPHYWMVYSWFSHFIPPNEVINYVIIIVFVFNQIKNHSLIPEEGTIQELLFPNIRYRIFVI